MKSKIIWGLVLITTALVGVAYAERVPAKARDLVRKLPGAMPKASA